MENEMISIEDLLKGFNDANKILAPYAEMIHFFIMNNNDLVNSVSVWHTRAIATKICCPELLLEDLMPQNLEETMRRNGLQFTKSFN